MSRISACGLRRPAAKVTLVGCGEGGPEVPRLAWPVRGEAELAGGVLVEQPADEATLGDQRGQAGGPPFGVEGLGGEAAADGGIVDDRDFGTEQALAHAVLEEARAAGHGTADNGAEQVADQAAGDAVLIQHRQRARGHLAGIEAAHRPFAGGATDLGRRLQALPMQGGMPIMVAFHGGAGAGNHRGRNGIAGALIGAGKAIAGDEQNAAAAGGGGGAVRAGHPRHVAAGLLGVAGALGQ